MPMMPLHELYLESIAACAEGENLSTIIQNKDRADPRDLIGGRLYFAPDGSTVPQVIVGFSFDDGAVTLSALHRDERTFHRVVNYAEGLDAFLADFRKFLRAGRLAAPKGRAA